MEGIGTPAPKSCLADPKEGKKREIHRCCCWRRRRRDDFTRAPLEKEGLREEGVISHSAPHAVAAAAADGGGDARPSLHLELFALLRLT